ncbi:MAG: VapE family protein, partial [Rhodoferax sp.]
RKVEEIEHTAAYEIDGALMGYVVRFRTSDGGKETLPYTWCTSARDGGSRWHWRQWDVPRPLYFPGKVSPIALTGAADDPLPTVILVEGEKKADILQALLDAHAPSVYLVASWSGGCNGWKKANWSWLAGCTVLLWPDCDAKREPVPKKERESLLAQAMAQLDQIGGQITDNDRLKVTKTVCDLAASRKPLLPVHKQPGMAAMLGIGALLRADHGCTVQLLPIPEPLAVPDGWDCADAINTNGWTGERVLAFFAQACALPLGDGTDAPAATADKGAAKKTASLVDTEGADDDSGFTFIGGRRIPDWLTPYYNKEKKCWMASRKMVILILERDPILAPVLAYNELSNNVQSRKLWPWPHAQVGDVTSAVDLLLGDYLTETYGLPSIARAALTEAIQTVAHKRRFHPVREYLQGVTWDKVSRIDKWLIHILGESPDTLNPAMREYFQLVGRYWLLGMVNRVMDPGCKFDYCPVLEGKGGLYKSTMVKILGGKEFYSDTPFEVGHGKEAQEQVQGLWLYEIAEMSNFSKSEVGAIKAFISSEVDRYRVAYGATVEKFQRQCVLVGTTNENTYLRDRTGNRRFWPIPVKHKINIAWLVKYRDQLMAEAYELFGQAARYTPKSDEEERLFAPMQESRLVESPVQSELLYLLTRDPTPTTMGQIVNNLTDFVTTAQLTKALEVDVAKSTPALDGQIRGWLDHQGWARVKKQINGARAWGYIRPANWPPVEDDNDMEAPPPPKVIGPVAEEGDDVPF